MLWHWPLQHWRGTRYIDIWEQTFYNGCIPYFIFVVYKFSINLMLIYSQISSVWISLMHCTNYYSFSFFLIITCVAMPRYSSGMICYSCDLFSRDCSKIVTCSGDQNKCFSIKGDYSLHSKCSTWTELLVYFFSVMYNITIYFFIFYFFLSQKV